MLDKKRKTHQKSGIGNHIVVLLLWRPGHPFGSTLVFNTYKISKQIHVHLTHTDHVSMYKQNVYLDNKSFKDVPSANVRTNTPILTGIKMNFSSLGKIRHTTSTFCLSEVVFRILHKVLGLRGNGSCVLALSRARLAVSH